MRITHFFQLPLLVLELQLSSNSTWFLCLFQFILFCQSLPYPSHLLHVSLFWLSLILKVCHNHPVNQKLHRPEHELFVDMRVRHLRVRLLFSSTMWRTRLCEEFVPVTGKVVKTEISVIKQTHPLILTHRNFHIGFRIKAKSRKSGS